MLSKRWLRMCEAEGDAWVAGQRWYCNCCAARYQPKFGMLTEVVASDGSVYWMLAEYPTDWHDVKWMAVEERHAGAASPAQLFAMLEQVRPYMGDGMLRQVTQQELCKGTPDGVYKVVDPKLVLAMPLWKWGDMLSFVKEV